ncbi:GNAT family N-acetyltransferase [Ideonella sp. DXS22W]|uniref:GNAT family N-acetyltransferase n=1 Tax=Pseudaquabacterium inlustre TaxID=2984192 RepID=A0ABU9CJI9_9BURK
MLDAGPWDALLAAQAQPTPFMRLPYLAALHGSGCATTETGWTPRFVTVHRDGELVAAAPAYLKTHSYGEYVFDWAWADAYHRHGLRYYPKLLVAVPFTPVPGTRLMARDDAARHALLAGLRAVAAQAKASGLHVLFHTEAETPAVAQAGGLARHGVQFHWQQQAQAPWPDFDAFLASLAREKRKKILQERRRVAEAGITFTTHCGAEIGDDLWRFFHACYTGTYRLHHSKPYLNLDFFQTVGRTLPEHWLLFVARRDGAAGTPVAASLVALDPARRAAFGRYWGATEYVPCLHFEACYYQPLAWCLAQGYTRFEGGAQGEHKMARGLMPAPTRSAHWLAHPEFNRAVAEHLAQEGQGIAAYIDELHEHSPFKA